MTQYVQSVWTSDNGLPSDSLMELVQDSKGFIWIGSYEGLIRFDGVEFKVYSKYTHPDFSSTSARILYSDSKGNLWIGTNGDGVARFNDETFTMFTTARGLPNNSIRKILQDNSGSIWIGTTGGLARMEEGKQRFEVFNQFKNSLIELIYQDSKGRIWLGPGEGGIFKLEGDRFVSPPEFKEMSGKVLLSMLEDNEGNLWLGTKDHGLHVIKDGMISQLGEAEGIGAKSINKLWKGLYNSIWIGTDSGLFRFFNNQISHYSEKNGLNNNLITSLLEDKEGSLWISTARGGLAKLSDSKFLTFSTPEGMVHNKVNSILEDRKGLIWIGTDAGLSLFKDGRFIKNAITDQFLGTRIRQIYQSDDGIIWLSTYSNRGVVAIKENAFRSYSTKDGISSNRCRVTFKDSKQNIWIGTSKGLNKINGESLKTFTRSKGLENDYIMTIFEDSTGKIWIGTDGGGVAYLENGEFKSLTTKDGLAANIVFKIFEDSRKTLWITTSGGISRFKDGRFFNITVKEGLKGDAIFQAIEDNNDQLWMMANVGVFRASLQDMYDLTDGMFDDIITDLYDTTDGLRASVTPTSWGVKSAEGMLYLPTMDGIVIIDPRQLLINPIPPPVYLEYVQVDENIKNPDTVKTLAPSDKRIVFKYTALSYVVPEKVKFQYMLKGFEDHWSEPTFKREASYTSLPPGDYSFRIRAANNDGVWNESRSYISFTQKPYFYQTTWFFVTLASSFALMVVLVYYVRIRTLRHRQLVLEQLLSERTKDLEIEKENYRGIVEDQTELICRFGSFYQLSFVNVAFCRYFGKTFDELIGSSFLMLIPEEEKPVIETLIATLNSDRQSTTVEIPTRITGETRWIDWTIRVLLDSNEQLIEYQCVGRDITERIQMENQLLEAKNLAEEANQAKSDFIADISHEIRTPMHAILGYTKLGISKIDKLSRETIAKYFAEIQSSGKRMIMLVTDLLDLSKLQTGRTTYVFEMYSLSETIKEIIGEFQALVAEKNITLQFINTNLIDHLMMDRGKIHQVLTNLLSNSIKFSNQDDTIKIQLENREDQFQVSIRDQGMGIPEDELEVIFDKFTQSSKTRSVSGGTGLGLSISKQIIIDHGGKIWAENNETGGATFHFVLPASLPL
ncbi:PAS domain S-box protein [bacterium]|nr:PAS domain S-box protein [bacterium]